VDTQQGFFDEPLPDPARTMAGQAGAGQPETAWQAALANPGGRGSMRLRILQYWFRTGYHRGYTDDELAIALDMHLPSLTRRRDELVRLGWLEPLLHQGAPLTRSTRRGSPARVWTLSPRARHQGLPPDD
jgi:hypothetical protein